MKAEYLSHMGDDLMVVNAARVSFDKKSDWKWEGDPFDATNPPQMGLSEKDTKLIRYLANHDPIHWTPFAHSVIQMRETVPIFVARQRFKHTVGFVYNETSRRYIDDLPEFYSPSIWRKRPDKTIKQGSGDPFDDEKQQELNTKILMHHQACMTCYLEMLDEGVAPEQARMVLPQSMYTSYYVTGSLFAWANAYNQRIDRSSAQNEIADLAEQWDAIIAPLFPVSWKELT